MQATPQPYTPQPVPPSGQILDLNLPLMVVAPHRTLSSAYVSTDTLARFDAIRQAGEALNVTLTLLYTYWDPSQQRFLGALMLDHTNAREAPDRITAVLAQVPGVVVLGAAEPSQGLAAFEKNHLSVAGTSVAVMARPFLGNTHKLLIESLGDRAATALFEAGELAGHLAAVGVPPLVATLGLQLSPQLIRQRFYDLQVFGWATISALHVNDQFTGEALLADDFEAGAWNGQATTAVCHWMRGFLSSALSSLAGHALQVSEPECQAKGDPYCRMVFSAA